MEKKKTINASSELQRVLYLGTNKSSKRVLQIGTEGELSYSSIIGCTTKEKFWTINHNPEERYYYIQLAYRYITSNQKNNHNQLSKYNIQMTALFIIIYTYTHN